MIIFVLHISLSACWRGGGVLICAPEAVIVLLQGLGRGDCGVPLFLLLGGDPPSSHRGCTCLGKKLDCVLRVIHIVIVICLFVSSIMGCHKYGYGIFFEVDPWE